jgi:hypothetical protein
MRTRAIRPSCSSRRSCDSVTPKTSAASCGVTSNGRWPGGGGVAADASIRGDSATMGGAASAFPAAISRSMALKLHSSAR